MKFKRIKGNPILTYLSLIIAAIVGMLTGVAVEGMPLANMLTTAVLTGVVAGGVLFFVLKLITRQKSG